MPYTGDPQNRDIDRVRLRVGDVGTTIETVYLTDDVYQFYLDIPLSERRSALAAAKAIKAEIAASAVRERVGQEEIFGQEAYQNYCQLIKDIEAEIVNGLGSSGIFAGGISVAAMCAVRANQDNVKHTVEKGQGTLLTGDLCDNVPRNPTQGDC